MIAELDELRGQLHGHLFKLCDALAVMKHGMASLEKEVAALTGRVDTLAHQGAVLEGRPVRYGERAGCPEAHL